MIGSESEEFVVFFFNDTATTEIYTLSLHDALPIYWIRAVYVSCQQQALRDLDRAFANFFAGRARYPTPRKKGINETFRFPGREIETRRLSGKWSEVRLPKIGWVKFRDTRPIRGNIQNVTVSGGADGWH